MAIPTVISKGATGGLLFITDHNGKSHRVPKNSVGHIMDSSNVNSRRIDISHVTGEITLIFSSAEEITTFLTAIDAEY